MGSSCSLFPPSNSSLNPPHSQCSRQAPGTAAPLRKCKEKNPPIQQGMDFWSQNLPGWQCQQQELPPAGLGSSELGSRCHIQVFQLLAAVNPCICVQFQEFWPIFHGHGGTGSAFPRGILLIVAAIPSLSHIQEFQVKSAPPSPWSSALFCV